MGKRVVLLFGLAQYYLIGARLGISIDEPYNLLYSSSYLLCLRGKEQYFIYCIDDELPSFASLCFRRQFLSSLHTSHHALLGIAERE